MQQVSLYFLYLSMNKSVLAIVFSILFTSFTVMPNILVIVDDTFDISIAIGLSEEEEKKGEEKSKAFEIKILQNPYQDFTTLRLDIVNFLKSYNNNYCSFSKELTSPPPDYYI